MEVAIVGGGAAGIAAAKRLRERGRSVLLIEAMPTLGGRARTVVLNDMPLDLGCEWLHSAERNPFVALAEGEGQIVDQRDGGWHQHAENKVFSAEDRQKAGEAYDQFCEFLQVHRPSSDCAADALARDDRWAPFINALSSFINGTELDDLSVADFVTYDTAASHNNWRLKNGYGALIAGLGAGVPAALETTVTSISYGNRVVLETNRGTMRAKAAIVTVSSAVLARGTIRFTPSIDEHLHAASCLPLGLANKVFLSIADPELVPAEHHAIGSLGHSGTGSYSLRPFGRPLIECYLGGAMARELEEAGESAAVSFVIGELRDLFGSDVARSLSPLAVTRWGQQPTILGSYSHALPGLANQRAVLARPVSDRLCFAGEACSHEDFSTAHGAWQSGIAAADWIENCL